MILFRYLHIKCRLTFAKIQSISRNKYYSIGKLRYFIFGYKINILLVEKNILPLHPLFDRIVV